MPSERPPAPPSTSAAPPHDDARPAHDDARSTRDDARPARHDDGARAGASTLGKVGLLTSLYASQGLPFGFFTQALPIVLRGEGATLTAIGFSSLLSLPWVLKALWAPLVDRVPAVRGGRRRATVLALQGALALLLAGLALVAPERALAVLIVGVLLSNLVSATQDIATDALAVEVLTARERGLGNGVQVAGYRVGMIVGSSALLVVYERGGHEATFTAMAVLVALLSIPMLLVSTAGREAPPPTTDGPRRSLLAAFVRRPGMGPWVATLLLFKGTDSFMTGMVKPLLVDHGVSTVDLAWLTGATGSGASLVGAVLGGVLMTRLARARALVGFGALQGLAQAAYLVPALGPATLSALTVIVVVENLIGSMATVALFTWMMDRARADQAGTDYTAQASLVVVAMGVGSTLSGLSADLLGHAGHLVLASVAYGAALVVIATRLLRQSPPEAASPGPTPDAPNRGGVRGN